MKWGLRISQWVPCLDNQLLGRDVEGHSGVLGNITFSPVVLTHKLCQITWRPQQTKLSSVHPQLHWFYHLKKILVKLLPLKIIAFDNYCLWKLLVKIANLYCLWEMLDARSYITVESPIPWNLSPDWEGNSRNKEFLKEGKIWGLPWDAAG